MRQKSQRRAYSLLELIAVAALLGVVATIIISRVSSTNDASKVAASLVYKGEIEIQAELWHHNTGSWPSSNLSAIGADLNYFPGGLPTCPVDGTPYTIDPLTGLVVGHNH